MINDEILEIISDAVSDYANNHWTSSDFDNDYQRGKYLREIADGNGWNDDVAEDVLEMLDGEEWEDETGTLHPIDIEDDDVINAVYEAISEEADYWAMD
jgi:hypothetical protein